MLTTAVEVSSWEDLAVVVTETLRRVVHPLVRVVVVVDVLQSK